MSMKLKWTVSAVPTGRYRSFERRGWPSAGVNERAAAYLYCEDEYVPAKVKTGDHSPIKIKVAEWFSEKERGDRGAFEWRTLKRRASTLEEAKELVQVFFDRHPEFLNPED